MIRIDEDQRGLATIWVSFAVFLMLFLLNLTIRTHVLAPTLRMWLILELLVTVASLLLLAKHKLPDRKHIVLSFVFGTLMFPATQGINPLSVGCFLSTVCCSLASFSIFSKYQTAQIDLVRGGTVKSAALSILTGIAAGSALGIINVVFSGNASRFSIHLEYFLVALSPAIFEEIALRAFLYAYCVHCLQGKIDSAKKAFACYFMMIIPHVMIHTPQQFISNGVISGIINIILLAALFGLPFAAMQRKRDLTSAMIAHGLVDLMRFCFFGMPIN